MANVSVWPLLKEGDSPVVASVLPSMFPRQRLVPLVLGEVETDDGGERALVKGCKVEGLTDVAGGGVFTARCDRRVDCLVPLRVFKVSNLAPCNGVGGVRTTDRGGGVIAIPSRS